MRKMIERVARLIRSEDGPTAVEYAVMLALIIVISMAAIRTIGTNANTAFTRVANSMAS